MTLDKLRQELARLSHPPLTSEKPSGIGTVRFVVYCPPGADEVLRRARTVLELVGDHSFGPWPDEATWRQLLPNWFIEACSSPMTQDEAECWLKWWQRLSPIEQSEAEISKNWSLDNWLYWMKPENRQWTWWEAQIVPDSDHLMVAVEVEYWPFPWGALRWLFKASGASAIDPES